MDIIKVYDNKNDAKWYTYTEGTVVDSPNSFAIMTEQEDGTFREVARFSFNRFSYSITMQITDAYG